MAGCSLLGNGSVSTSPPQLIQCAKAEIPPDIIAEAMEAMRGGATDGALDVRWSAPISDTEMKYVEDYVKARYPTIYKECVVGISFSMPMLIEDSEAGRLSEVTAEDLISEILGLARDSEGEVVCTRDPLTRSTSVQLPNRETIRQQQQREAEAQLQHTQLPDHQQQHQQHQHQSMHAGTSLYPLTSSDPGSHSHSHSHSHGYNPNRPRLTASVSFNGPGSSGAGPSHATTAAAAVAAAAAAENQHSGNIGYGRRVGRQQSPHWLMSRFMPSGRGVASEPNTAVLKPWSRLKEIMVENSDHAELEGAISVPEVHARRRILQLCGLDSTNYHVVFTESVKEAMILVGDAYPFHGLNVYLTALDPTQDPIAMLVKHTDAKAFCVDNKWLDLRQPGSHLSTHFRRKSKTNPKGLFAFPIAANGAICSPHWVSEAQRNLWHVLLDASALSMAASTSPPVSTVMPVSRHNVPRGRVTLANSSSGGDPLSGLTLQQLLGEHKPDYVVCLSPPVVGYSDSPIPCLLVRKSSLSVGDVDDTSPHGHSRHLSE